MEIFGDCPEELWEEVAPGTEAEELRDGKATWSTMAGSETWASYAYALPLPMNR